LHSYQPFRAGRAAIDVEWGWGAIMAEGQNGEPQNVLAATPTVTRDDRIFAFEGPVPLDLAFVLDGGQHGGVRGSLERYSDEVVGAVMGGDSRGFVLGLLGDWGSGKTSAMLMLLDLIAERLRGWLPPALVLESRVSPQEPLARALQVTDPAGNHYFPVTSSLLRAPLSLRPGKSDDARLALAYAILWGMPPEPQSAIAQWLGFKPVTATSDLLARRLETEQFLRKELRERAATGTEVEQWIRDARASCLADAGPAHMPVFLRRNIHLTMLDDLDRTRLDYTAQILNAMRFWVDTEGMFFVVAATADYLSRAARLANDVAAEDVERARYTPDQEALQKFVHHELHMPALLRSRSDVAKYWKQLLSSHWTGAPRNWGLELLRDELDSFIGESARNPLGVLTPLLSPRVIDLDRPVTPVPREAKRLYNALVAQLSGLTDDAGQDDAGKREMKRIVAALAWRDAWQRFVEPAWRDTRIGEVGPKFIALRGGLDLAARVLPSTVEDLSSAVFRLREKADEARLDLTGIPPTLLLYLAADPPYRLEEAAPDRLDGGLGSIRESDIGKPEASTARPDRLVGLRPSPEDEHVEVPAEGHLPFGGAFALRDTKLEQETYSLAQDISSAATAGDLRHARSLTDQLVRQLERFTTLTDAGRVAPTIGNAALRVESGDAQLAWDLHRLAHSLNPEHSNIRLNLSDFLLDYARGEDAWSEVERQLDWVAAHEPEFKRERQVQLRARLAQARGDNAGSRALVDTLIASSREPGATFEKVLDALTALSDLKETAAFEDLIHNRLNLRLPDDQGAGTYRLLRVLGEELIEGEAEVESRGIDILRYLLAEAFCPDESDVASVLNNLAWIYNYRGRNVPVYKELAGMLWRHAVELEPGDASVREAYARYLERDPDNVRRLQLGQMPTIPLPSYAEVRELVRGLDARLSSGPWWWEDFRPLEPAYGFPPLAVTEDAPPPEPSPGAHE
jgi:hypothetical protein